MNRIIWFIAFGGIVMSLNIFANGAEVSASKYLDGQFHNSEITYQSSLGNVWKIVKQYWQTERKEPAPMASIPVKPLTTHGLLSDENDAIYRLGHSTLLIRLGQEFILIDPVFSERASPVQWAGPKRFHQSPISIAQLPEIKAVVISHDHYDHLDKASVLELAEKVERFITPLKVGKHLKDWGISSDKITELDWWESQNVAGINIVATPSQHFSGRGLFDKDQSLWASWVIEYSDLKLFYSGDSGYFSGFKEIGQRYGPFDYTMIETGAYNELWREIHMTPEQSLQAHLDLQGKYLIPVHNGTFDLALHDWFEPFERISVLAKKNSVSLLTPIFGQAITLKQPQSTKLWWREVMSSNALKNVSVEVNTL